MRVNVMKFVLNALVLFALITVAVLMGLYMSGCVTENKAVGFSNGIEGFKLEVTGSASTGSYPLPQIWLAGDTFSYASAPALKEGDKTQIVFTATTRRSFFGSLFGIEDTSSSMSYIGNPNETAAETAKRIKALKSVMSSSVTTDSSITN